MRAAEVEKLMTACVTSPEKLDIESYKNPLLAKTIIESFGIDGTKFEPSFANVPPELKNKKTVTTSKSTTTKPDTASSVDDPLEAKLKKLKKLLEMGLITEEEAAAKRAKILEDL